MRPNCPLCGSTHRRDDWKMEFLVPDGWPNPTTNTVCLCLDCGMIYYDNDMMQADYDEYYHKYYGYDGNEHSENNIQRLDEIADLVALPALGVHKDDLIVDFGGGKNSYLVSRLTALGYTRAVNVDVGDELPKGIDLLISAQTFEHLYDLKPITARLVGHLSYKGAFIVEIPSTYEMTYIDPPMPILDFHQKHVNHFTHVTLDRLFSDFGFTRIYAHSGSTPCYFGWHYRAVYKKHVQTSAYENARKVIEVRTYQKLEKLRAIGDRRVIIWGCGDLCLHLLSQVSLNVAYYVDNDPAFDGATINGVPVWDRVTSEEPIVVIAQNQASGILKRIKELNLTNKVIVI